MSFIVQTPDKSWKNVHQYQFEPANLLYDVIMITSGSSCSKHHLPNELVKRSTKYFTTLSKKYFTTLSSQTIFFVEKMREAFAVQKLLTFFQQKILAYLRY